jgi:hypothetical protein
MGEAKRRSIAATHEALGAMNVEAIGFTCAGALEPEVGGHAIWPDGLVCRGC